MSLSSIVAEVAEVSKAHQSYAYRFVYTKDYEEELKFRNRWHEDGPLTEVRVVGEAVEYHPCKLDGTRVNDGNPTPNSVGSGGVSSPGYQTVRQEIEEDIRAEVEAKIAAGEPPPAAKKRKWFKWL